MLLALSGYFRTSFAFGPQIAVRGLGILTSLVEKVGALVLKGELEARVWPNRLVSEGQASGACRRLLYRPLSPPALRFGYAAPIEFPPEAAYYRHSAI
jgi:hypothetical protein